MPKAKPKSKNPAYPEAHPTAPGGMSEKALLAEMVQRHGYNEEEAMDMKWPDKINAVIEGRLREDEARREAAQPDDEVVDYDPTPEADDETSLIEVDDAEEEDDFDRLMAELEAEDDEHEVGQIDRAVQYESVMAENEGKPVGAVEEALVDAGLDPDEDDVEAEVASMLDEHDRAEVEALADLPAPLLVKIPGVLDYVFDGHMGAGPSASERWMHCTASLGASRAFLETLTRNQQIAYAKASLAARQGLTAHSAAEVEASRMLGRITEDELENALLELSVIPETEGEAYDDTMAEYIEEYVDLIESYARERGNDHVMLEARVTAVVPLTGLHEGEVYEITGSSDTVILPGGEDGDATELVVGDLKYGDGIDVSVDENPQVRIYALGVLGLLVDDDGVLTTPIETVTYHIVQPRLGGIKTWSEPLADLLSWRDDTLAPRLTEALFGVDYGATFVPGEAQCQFCPARGTCAALAEQRIAQAAELFDLVQDTEFTFGSGAVPDTGALTDERLGTLLAQALGVKKIAEDLKDEAQRRLHRGASVPGFHLVNYQPPRQWVEGADERLSPEAHGDEGAVLKRKQRERLWITEPRLLSPTQAVALFNKEHKDAVSELEPLIETPEKRPVVAPVTDRRKPWIGVPPEQMFADETSTEV